MEFWGFSKVTSFCGGGAVQALGFVCRLYWALITAVSLHCILQTLSTVKLVTMSQRRGNYCDIFVFAFSIDHLWFPYSYFGIFCWVMGTPLPNDHKWHWSKCLEGHTNTHIHVRQSACQSYRHKSGVTNPDGWNTASSICLVNLAVVFTRTTFIIIRIILNIPSHLNASISQLR